MLTNSTFWGGSWWQVLVDRASEAIPATASQAVGDPLWPEASWGAGLGNGGGCLPVRPLPRSPVPDGHDVETAEFWSRRYGGSGGAPGKRNGAVLRPGERWERGLCRGSGPRSAGGSEPAGSPRPALTGGLMPREARAQGRWAVRGGAGARTRVLRLSTWVLSPSVAPGPA